MLRGTRVILRGFQCGVSTKREEHMTTANGQTPAPFMQNAPAVISTLGTDAHQGLTSEQAAHNLNQYGPNAFTKPKPESMLSRIVKTAADPMLIMLMIAAAITLGVNITRAMAGGHADILECVGIFFAIALSVTITVVMEGRSAKAFEALNDINDDTTVTVVRDGEVTLVSQRDITIGDVLQISTGDKLPADARLIESNDLTADESALTGESVPSAKAADAVFTDPKTPVADRTNMLYSGCFVTAGNGRAVVTAVGDDTEFGKIARELRAANTGMTPLQEKLAKLGKVIAVVGSIVAALVFVLQVARFVASGTASFDTISEAFITSITLIVAAVPEGLPTIVAACLAVNIIKMSKQNALVKKMVACETMLHQRDLLGQNRHVDPEPHDRDRGVQRAGPRLGEARADQEPHAAGELLRQRHRRRDLPGRHRSRGRRDAGIHRQPHRMRTVGRRAQGRTRLPDSPRARDGAPHVSVLVGDQEHDHCGA